MGVRLFFCLLLLMSLTITSQAVQAESVIPTAGMQLWLRSDAGVEVGANGNSVTRWLDQSIAGGHAVSAAGSAPVLTVDNNGKPVVRFSEEAYMVVSHRQELNAHEGLSVFVVYRTTSGNRIMQKKSHATVTEDTWFVAASNGLGIGRSYRSGTALFPISTDLHIAAHIFDPGRRTIEIFRNGSIVDTVEDVKPHVPNTDDLYIGKRHHPRGTELPWQGDLYELIIYNRALNDDEREAVSEYLLEKYFELADAAGGTDVVLLGDSIRRGYQSVVVNELGPDVRVWFSEDNNRYTSYLLTSLEAWMSKLQPKVVHVNAGLHDLWLSNQKHRIPIPEYKENLRRIVAIIREQTDATIIWATTTPVIDSRILERTGVQSRRNADVELYNAAAIEVMEDLGVQINDLYTLVMQAGPEKLISSDGVHFTSAGYELLGKAVAEAVRAALTQLE